MVSVLPWLPQTTSSVALRLMELDNAICYTLNQKEDSQKDKGAWDFMMRPSKYAVMKNIPDNELTEAPHEVRIQEPWFDLGSGQTSSGRGRGRGRTRGGKSQRRVNGSRSKVGQRSTTVNSERFGQLVGWKGRTRGRGGRRRGRRTIRSRQKKPVKRVAEIVVDGDDDDDDTKDFIFERSPINQDWNAQEETTPMQVESAENASSSERSEYDDDDNGPPMGDEYDDLMVDDYSHPGVFDGKPERLMEGINYGDEDDDDHAEEDDDDEVGDDDFEEEDEEVNVDVEGYFNVDSDEEGNRDISGGQLGNPDEVTGSSSSEYSD